MLRKDWADLDANGKKGDWTFMNREIGITIYQNAYIVLKYGDVLDDVVVLPLLNFGDGKAWKWDFNKEAPTLQPSILVYGKNGEPLWHGYLEHGILREV